MIKKFLWATLANFAVGPDAGLPSKVAPITTDRENGFRRDGSADAGKLNYLFNEVGDKLQKAAWIGAKTSRTSFTHHGSVVALERLPDIQSWAGFVDDGAGKMRALLGNNSISAHTSGVTGGTVTFTDYVYSTYVNHAGPLGAKGALFVSSGTSTAMQLLDNDIARTSPPTSFVPVAATSLKDVAFDGADSVYIVEGASFIRGSAAGVWSQFAASGNVAAGHYSSALLGPSAGAGKTIIFASSGSNSIGYISGTSFTEQTIIVNGGAGLPGTWVTRWFSRPVWDSLNSRWIVQAGDASGMANIKWYAVTSEDTITPISSACNYLVGQGVAEVIPGVLAALAMSPTAGLAMVPEIILSFDGGATWHRTGARMGAAAASAAAFRTAGRLKASANAIAATHAGEYLVLGPWDSQGLIT
jgi:hypothetical protein